MWHQSRDALGAGTVGGGQTFRAGQCLGDRRRADVRQAPELTLRAARGPADQEGAVAVDQTVGLDTPLRASAGGASCVVECHYPASGDGVAQQRQLPPRRGAAPPYAD